MRDVEGDQTKSRHVRPPTLPAPAAPVRTDLSATLFLSEPEEYDGGELEIEGVFGMQAVKLEAGDLILYPSSSLHRVTPVTRGARVASFFWIESLVGDDTERTLLFDLERQCWCPEMLALFRVPAAVLPEVCDSAAHFGETQLLGGEIPIRGIAGDQQAALFGQGATAPGLAAGLRSSSLMKNANLPIRRFRPIGYCSSG